MEHVRCKKRENNFNSKLKQSEEKEKSRNVEQGGIQRLFKSRQAERYVHFYCMYLFDYFHKTLCDLWEIFNIIYVPIPKYKIQISSTSTRTKFIRQFLRKK